MNHTALTPKLGIPPSPMHTPNAQGTEIVRFTFVVPGNMPKLKGPCGHPGAAVNHALGHHDHPSLRSCRFLWPQISTNIPAPSTIRSPGGPAIAPQSPRVGQRHYAITRMLGYGLTVSRLSLPCAQPHGTVIGPGTTR